MSVSVPTPLEPGAPFAERYVIERQLGTGGMASVWLAYDRTLGRCCALKVLDLEQATNPEACRRFHREARVTARIRSASVVNIFDHGEWQGLPYIAMEYLDGEDLASRLEREGKLDIRQTCDVIAQVALGLTHAHASGVVHRDVKPENIFLMRGDEGEVAKVLDFGIAKQVECAPAHDVTQVGLFLGTPLYASPEQIRSRGVDWRTDLWSLGVVAFECLTGRPPFAGGTLGELCGVILFQPLPRLTELNAALPAELDDWLQVALARDPERRYQSAKELADAFADAVDCAKAAMPTLAPRPEMPSEPGDLSSKATLLDRGRRLLPRILLPALVLLLAVAVGYRRTRLGVSPPTAVSAASKLARGAVSALAPQVTVAVLPETTDDVCRARLQVVKASEADSALARSSRAPRDAKSKASPAPSSVEAWRLQPGF
jgi:serine/threonine-protein kinase